MRRTLPLWLSLLLAVPSSALAQAEDATEDEEETKPQKKSKGDSAEQKGEMNFEGLELTPKRKKKVSEQPDTQKAAVVAKPDKDKPTDKPEISAKPEEEKPTAGFSRHRYGYVIGGGFLVTGLAFAYSAQGEAKRAETIGTARESAQALENARASAATANVIYGAAAVTLAVALLFEVLPEPVAEKASLTFHF